MTGDELVEGLRQRGLTVDRWWVYVVTKPKYDGIRLVLNDQFEIAASPKGEGSTVDGVKIRNTKKYQNFTGSIWVLDRAEPRTDYGVADFDELAEWLSDYLC